MIQFLQERQFQFDRAKLNIDVYLSNKEAKEYQRLAKEIDSQRYFTIYSCNDCIKTLIKFVFENYGKSKPTNKEKENSDTRASIPTLPTVQESHEEQPL